MLVTLVMFVNRGSSKVVTRIVKLGKYQKVSKWLMTYRILKYFAHGQVFLVKNLVHVLFK